MRRACPVYIVHVSCEQAHEAIRRARQKGHARLSASRWCSTLVLDEGEYFDKDWEYCRPARDVPARSAAKEHQDGLWAGLAAGSLQVVATDHCRLHDRAEADGDSPDFTDDP